MKWKQPRSRFELGFSCPFATTITTTRQPSPLFIYVCMYFHVYQLTSVCTYFSIFLRVYIYIYRFIQWLVFVQQHYFLQSRHQAWLLGRSIITTSPECSSSNLRYHQTLLDCLYIYIKHNRHFMPTYFLLDPFESPYYFYRIRGELI